MRHLGRAARARLIAGVATAVLACSAGFATAQEREPITIAPQPLESALYDFGGQTGLQVLFAPGLATAKRTAGTSGETDVQLAMARLLQGTGLTYRRDGDMFVIVEGEGGSDPQSAGAAGDGAEVEALIVTAQKKEEDIQDVPIAISAFSQKDLEAQKIEGGFDLLKAIPNVTFSKNNFSSYNFSIRGVGTKAISVTTDPGVAVEFNDTPLIRNRLFEQEYFDVERVEVLRGPQGTLHGRNATAGVINVISRKPDLDEFSGSIKGEVGNYDAKRLSASLNVPLVEDVLALRFAGAITSREGYDYNATTKNKVNGRDLWSARLTVGFQPNERLRGDFIWERFEEDDNRSRTGKQLCHHDTGPADIGSVNSLSPMQRGGLSQGCKPGSLYDAKAFGTPNGLSIPFVLFSQMSFMAMGFDIPAGQIGDDPMNFYRHLMSPLKINLDPYGGMMQSPDLRVINSIRDPRYRATTDVLELNLSYDLSDTLTLTSLTAYVKDEIYSFQDFNRFNTIPIFNDSSQAYGGGSIPCAEGTVDTGMGCPSYWRGFMPGGIFNDPQIGPSDSIAGFDISQAESEQLSQEIRLQSSFDGRFNFSLGANYTRYETLEDYYVMYNIITAIAQIYYNQSLDITKCWGREMDEVPADPFQNCAYIDPNPVESINGDGHNYFRSQNPYELSSSAVFGELYWQFNDAFKLTAGARYTDDRKTFTPVPSQVLLSLKPLAGAGTVNRGHPADPDIKQQWGEWSGRLGVEWRPELALTDDTMVYAFYSHGYKGGGANPPGIGYQREPICGLFPDFPDFCFPPFITPLSYPATFEPEFIDAFEIGAKNSLVGGAMTLNATAFYYDYKDYQVSQIKERTAVNENFDATVWGVELESVFALSRNLRFNASLGYQDTEIGEGERSIDLMDRLQGHDDYILAKPWVQAASNCVLSRQLVVDTYSVPTSFPPDLRYPTPGFCPGNGIMSFTHNPLTGAPLDMEATYPNGGLGFYDDVSGNELPNAPHWTVSLGAQYGWEFMEGWRATVRGDAYWQSQSWARVYNAVNDKLHGWYNANLSLWIERPEDDLKIELYAKNILDKTPITDAFLNSDDTALTTNVFVLDPRLIGFSITKGF